MSREVCSVIPWDNVQKKPSVPRLEIDLPSFIPCIHSFRTCVSACILVFVVGGGGGGGKFLCATASMWKSDDILWGGSHLAEVGSPLFLLLGVILLVSWPLSFREKLLGDLSISASHFIIGMLDSRYLPAHFLVGMFGLRMLTCPGSFLTWAPSIKIRSQTCAVSHSAHWANPPLLSQFLMNIARAGHLGQFSMMSFPLDCVSSPSPFKRCRRTAGLYSTVPWSHWKCFLSFKIRRKGIIMII